MTVLPSACKCMYNYSTQRERIEDQAIELHQYIILINIQVKIALSTITLIIILVFI